MRKLRRKGGKTNTKKEKKNLDGNSFIEKINDS